MALERDPLGRKAVLYYSTTLVANPLDFANWIAGANVAGDVYDESDNLDAEYADITTRRKAKGGFRAQKPVLRNGEATFDFSWETNNVSEPFVQAVIDASNNLSELAFWFADYPYDDPAATTGDIIQGLHGNFYVSFTKTAAIGDAQRASCTATISSEGQWHKFTTT